MNGSLKMSGQRVWESLFLLGCAVPLRSMWVSCRLLISGSARTGFCCGGGFFFFLNSLNRKNKAESRLSSCAHQAAQIPICSGKHPREHEDSSSRVCCSHYVIVDTACGGFRCTKTLSTSNVQLLDMCVLTRICGRCYT